MKKLLMMLASVGVLFAVNASFADGYFCPQSIAVTVGADRGATDDNGYDLYDVSNVVLNGKEPAASANLLFVNDSPALLNMMAPEGPQFAEGNVLKLTFTGAAEYKGLQQCNYTLMGEKNAGTVKLTSFAANSYTVYGNDWHAASAALCTENSAAACEFVPAQ